MKEEEKKLTHTLEDIKQMMERSSRFISLSGLSGIAAGCCALAGAYFAHISLATYAISSGSGTPYLQRDEHNQIGIDKYTSGELFLIAVTTFFTSLLLAFFFTYLRSKKKNIPVWGTAARRLMINVTIPLIVGGIFILKMVEAGAYDFVAPGCLIFYGLSLLNASKYTLKEIQYLGYIQMVLGILNLWFSHYSLFFWAFGFGVMHIIYGTVMWWKYERTAAQND